MHLPSDQDASGRSFGELELKYLAQVLDSGRLTGTRGHFVGRLEQDFSSWVAGAGVVACSSGSAAIHAALAALSLEPGDEVITTSITDMGALTPILFQGAVPVFADVDAESGNVTASTLEAAISPRTRAVIVTHLFGFPCEMEPIMALTRRHRLRVVEDCAQAYGAQDQGRPVGSWGDLACFSLQQGKHITCGEGGLVSSREPELLNAARLFINKAWGFEEPQPDHRRSALNYRMTELQAAVACAQLERLPDFLERRLAAAAQMRELVPQFAPPERAGTRNTYWRYPLRLPDPDAAAARLAGLGVRSYPRYTRKPAFECEIFQRQQTLGDSRWPFTLARPEALDYRSERFPGTYRALANWLVLPWNERLERTHIDQLAGVLSQC